MTISIRLTPEEAELIRAYANLKNQSVSEVMRRAILEQIEDEFDLDVYEKAMTEYRENPKTYSLDEIEKEMGLR
ncbi:MAG: ribbon-helix-helix protein, CopG family [Desulfitobacterium sp.]|nr:ribbon-helix-helix protein, CopG family [Desulfitobacterium sp.]